MHKIKSQNELNTDFAKKHKKIIPATTRSSAEIDADLKKVMLDGYVIIEGLLSQQEINNIREEIEPLLEKSGRNNFEGYKTQRVYDVLSKTTVIDSLATHPRILGLMDKFFQAGFLLSQAQAINILSEEEAQVLHYDDAFYQIPRPRQPLGAALVLAIDDFTEENGATVVIPGSHKWGTKRIGTQAEAITALMPAGSAVFFLGTTWHGGGNNQSGASRLAVTCQYCDAYMRQQENFLLEISKERARKMSPELLSLIGYSIYGPFMGMVNGQHPKRVLGL